METITYPDFEKVELRAGKIVDVEEFPEARKPAYKLTIDFGEKIGTKRSSAQCTHYNQEKLIGRFVVCVVNFPPKQIATFMSECLVCGAPMEDGKVALLHFEEDNVQLGSKIF